MPSHYAMARAPAEARRISAYLDKTNLTPDNPLPSKELLEAVFEKGDDLAWAKRNISTIAGHLDGYFSRGAPFTYYGRTCRAYFWFNPSTVEDAPELNPEALEFRVNQLQASLDRIEDAVNRLLYPMENPVEAVESQDGHYKI